MWLKDGIAKIRYFQYQNRQILCTNFHHVTYFDAKNERQASARNIIFDRASWFVSN